MSERKVPYKSGLVSLADKAGVASEELSEVQRDARTAAWQSIMTMLGAVRGQLGEHALKGMENLSTSTFPYRAAQIRRKRPWEPLPLPNRQAPSEAFGDEVLVLEPTVELVMACRNQVGEIRTRPVSPADVTAEDAEVVAEALVWALRRHIMQTGVSRERYRKIRTLAQKLEHALSDGGR